MARTKQTAKKSTGLPSGAKGGKVQKQLSPEEQVQIDKELKKIRVMQRKEIEDCLINGKPTKQFPRGLVADIRRRLQHEQKIPPPNPPANIVDELQTEVIDRMVQVAEFQSSENWGSAHVPTRQDIGDFDYYGKGDPGWQPRRPPKKAGGKKYYPGEMAFLEVLFHTRRTKLELYRKPFRGLIKDLQFGVVDDMNKNLSSKESSAMVSVKRWKEDAYVALQEAAEAYLVEVFMDSRLCMEHRERDTLRPSDMKLARKLRGEVPPRPEYEGTRESPNPDYRPRDIKFRT